MKWGWGGLFLFFVSPSGLLISLFVESEGINRFTFLSSSYTDELHEILSALDEMATLAC